MSIYGQPQTMNLTTESCPVDQTFWHWPSTTNSADDSAVISLKDTTIFIVECATPVRTQGFQILQKLLSVLSVFSVADILEHVYLC